MSNRVFVLDHMEGNSNLGVPVFSNFGKMNNYQYLALSPVQPDIQKKDDKVISYRDQLQFKIQKNIVYDNGLSPEEITVKNEEI